MMAFGRSSSQKKSKHPNKKWNYIFKKRWSKHHINKWQKSKNRNKIEFNSQTEEPIIIDNITSFDSQYFWGANTEGCSVYIMVRRNYSNVAEVALILTMADGTTYRLPNQPDTVVFDASSKTWHAGDLKIMLLEPFKRWRIIFNGIVKKGNKKEWISDTDLSLHLQMNFIWIAGSKPLRILDDCNSNMLAKTLALETWNDSNWMDLVKSYPVNGYDQYGSLFGLITVGEPVNPVEIFLSGVRERRWGLHYSMFMKHLINLTGKASDGTYYNISFQSLEEGLNQLVLGNVRLPNSLVCPIEWININIEDIEKTVSHSSEEITIKFKTASKLFTTVIKLDVTKINLLRGGRPWSWENTIIPFRGSIDDYQGVGILQLGHKYSGDCPFPVPELNEKMHLSFTEIKNIKIDNICLSLNDPEACCSQFVGAKASSLALLLSVESEDYAVPNGFCLTTYALELHLTNNPFLKNAIKDIENNNSNENKEVLKNFCDNTYKLFIETDLFQTIKESVNTHFGELIKLEKSVIDDSHFAVRSSGIGEDLEDLSAAGQNATILGCKTVEDIYLAIQKCWASLFAYQSVEYRRQHGQNVNCGMGVVIQTMVEAESAGVMFTRHPMSGDPSCILITSNYGLGESVVSGKIEPDSIYIERDLDNKIKIKKIDLGSKLHKIILDKSYTNTDSRLQTIEINEESRKPSINEENCLKLGNIAINQEALWGDPRDIEWAISNSTIYLVQARPITTLQTWTEFELLHELDTPIMSDDDLMTFANMGEIKPGCTTPLSHSTISTFMEQGVSIMFGKPFNEYFFDYLASTHYHIGTNCFNVLLGFVPKELNSLSKLSDISIFGRVVKTENMHSLALHRNGITNKFLMVKLMSKMIKNGWNTKSAAKKAANYSKSFEIDLSKCFNSIDIFQKIDEHLPMIFTPADLHNAVTAISSGYQTSLFSLLMKGNNDISTENYVDFGTILSTCEDIISADVPKSLNNLVKTIQESSNSRIFSELEPKNGVRWLKDNSPDSYKKFNEFLLKHGHRSVKEFDLETDTWDLNPEKLIIVLQSALKAPTLKEKKKVEGDIVERLVSSTTYSTRKMLNFMIPICQKSVANREATKSALIYTIHKFRLAYRKLGKQMVKEWKIPDEKLIYFFTRTELHRYLKYGKPEYVNKAILRQRYFPKWEKFRFSEFCWGFPKPLENMINHNSIDDCKVLGSPISIGKVVGRACVIHNISEISELENGDILITNSTDIGWSPYFPLLTGVVTELGGLISHGAVIAREYGLPCIVGATNATSIFMTGDMVILNATEGVLSKTIMSES